MPQKTLNERAKQAKRRGEKVPIKLSDVGDTGALSTHAAKKHRGMVGMVKTADRSVDAKRPPGRGKTKTMPAAAAYVRKARSAKTAGEDVGVGLSKGANRNRTSGRKKAPSQMNIKRKGGPMKRSRLHGG
ncbi:MAG TPA: hypothetical protein VK420_18655 [Longimicrobium sp.]|nr:hypothetical protein [Longimicrobium sp.]